MSIQMKDPFHITAGLYPGIKVGAATIECREAAQFYIVGDGWQHRVEGFKPGAFADLQSMFGAMLSFLSHWAGAVHKCVNQDIDDIGMFPMLSPLAEWAIESGDEMATLSAELEGGEDRLIEATLLVEG